MKATVFLSATLAFTATAEMQLYSLPTPAKRDLATVTSVVAQISGAITQLDNSVKAFDKDGAQVQSDAENLASTIKNGTQTIASAGAISINDALGLQDVATSLATAGQTLLADLESKKAAFQASGLCESVQSTIESVGSEVQSFVDGIVKQLPEDAQAAASQFTGGISSALTSGAAALQCTGGSASSSSSSAAAVETTADAVQDAYPTSALTTSSSAAAETGAVTVTVTAPCVCESTTSVSIPIVTPSVSIPYPTGSNSTSVLPTGAVTTTPTGIPTAGASAHGVEVVGLMAGLAAALFV
ncbi:hydrophobic surface binding protein A-domain-containing protein [Xylaria grammica]|nr:hydrophobic surface binding protein A-domain-containing protein [Xylaria grammica]